MNRASLWLCLLWLGALPGLCAETVVDELSGRGHGYTPTMFYGDVGRTKQSIEGTDKTGFLRVDFDFRGKDTNHWMLTWPLDLDLAGASTVSFDVRGAGDKANVFLFLYDGRGAFNNYGVHGSNTDFHTAYADWHHCTVKLETDRTCQGGGVDLGDIRRVGLMFWSMGPVRGTAWVRNLAVDDNREPSVLIQPGTISPNGDGVNDVASIVIRGPRDCRVTGSLLDRKGRKLATLLDDQPLEQGRQVMTFDGRVEGKTLSDERYVLQCAFSGSQTVTRSSSLRVSTRHCWPAIRYTNKPFFPIGVWLEGSPGYAGYPSEPAGARQYYDRVFADLHAHGLNAAAVPNCPEALWETLLQSAQRHQIKIALEVGPLVALVSREGDLSEREVYATVRRVVDKIGKYPSLMRYQVRDEPAPGMIPNWILVQRVLAAVDPARPAFSCFCQPESLSAVSSQTPLSEAVFDIYPLNQATPLQTIGGFVPAFNVFSKAAGANPKWAVIQAFGVSHAKGSWRYPTPEELRAETYLSLAGGAQGIFFFIYSHIPGYLDGMVASDGTTTPMYAPTMALAGELHRLAPLLLRLKPDAREVTVKGEAIAGGFMDGRSQVLIVASTKPSAEQTVTITLPSTGRYRDALTGESFAAQASELSVSLAAGGGRVLLAQ